MPPFPQGGTIPGIITVPQTFGEKLNANPHFHVLATIPPCGIDPETGGYFETRFPSFWELRSCEKIIFVRHPRESGGPVY